MYVCMYVRTYVCMYVCLFVCMFYLCLLKKWFWNVLMFWYGIYINGHNVQKRMVTQRLECDYLYCTYGENRTNKNGNATLINGHLSDWTNNGRNISDPGGPLMDQ